LLIKLSRLPGIGVALKGLKHQHRATPYVFKGNSNAPCKGKSQKTMSFKVGGYRDHVHISCLLLRKVPQMKLVEEIKKQSSKWIKTKDQTYSDFYWQDRYGIFSVNPSENDVVVTYIDKQQGHHKKLTQKDEFRAFLKKYRVDYDERYFWD
jgi:hypothetical protein